MVTLNFMQSSSETYDKEVDLSRFVDAQASVYAKVLSELKNGQKQTHWMWYVFPQLDGLGHSSTARYYSIQNLAEARAYLSHPLLGARLIECANLVLDITGSSAHEIFGYPDEMKLHSCMTLFANVEGSDSVFSRVLDKYYQGNKDALTLQLLGN